MNPTPIATDIRLPDWGPRAAGYGMAKKVSLGNNYTEDEDVALCQAYVYGGKNASWKNNMSSNDFWEKKVLLKFIELCGNDPVAQTRKASHLKNNNRRKTTT
eukprot:CAMPEP_0168791938 /NCGR_PEP_ID=MMETSP0725-20121227/14252_1 /TAXON_ID=265536 /ORGANISM="Amphiprora sp., Strain CCMP467" /LENGTH=101 /DNA_ID=CAMNT_0008842547 /DNA_START=69 /DNA_END=371 /DNA_ORIENTATION=-